MNFNKLLIMISLLYNIILLVTINKLGYTLGNHGDINQYCEDNKNACNTADPRLSYNVINDFTLPNVDIEDVVNEITSGEGFVILPRLFSPAEIKHARELILYLIQTQGKKATHFQGSDESKENLQARVWNLLNKGKVFEKFIQHPTILKVMRTILGDDAQLGSIASNTIFPGGSGQEPHLDYPYWDYYSKQHWPQPPKHRDIPFFMNFQATIFLDDFTQENGATAVRPGTQRFAEYPSDSSEFFKHAVRGIGKAGDVMVFTGLLHHCAMPNQSNASRTGVLLQYLPKYIRPMEDIKQSISKKVVERMTGEMKKLLLYNYPYPAILDKAEATNSEGSNSKFNWKE